MNEGHELDIDAPPDDLQPTPPPGTPDASVDSDTMPVEPPATDPQPPSSEPPEEPAPVPPGQ